MSSNKDKVIRFSVGDQANGTSSVWRVWFNKLGNNLTSDVYLSYRCLGGIQKVSIHQSGEIQYSFTSEYAKKNQIANPLRHIDKWSISDNSPIFKILVPYTELKQTEINDNKVKLIQAPSKGNAIEVFLYITKESIVTALPSEFNMFEEQTLNNGSVLSLIWRDNLITENNNNLYLSHKKKIKKIIHDKSISGKDLRGMLFLNNDGKERGFIDLSL